MKIHPNLSRVQDSHELRNTTPQQTREYLSEHRFAGKSTFACPQALLACPLRGAPRILDARPTSLLPQNLVAHALLATSGTCVRSWPSRSKGTQATGATVDTSSFAVFIVEGAS